MNMDEEQWTLRERTHPYCMCSPALLAADQLLLSVDKTAQRSEDIVLLLLRLQNPIYHSRHLLCLC